MSMIPIFQTQKEEQRQVKEKGKWYFLFLPPLLT